MSEELPTLRWGIVATGKISTAFVEDLLLVRQDRKAIHIVQAIGSSSQEKGEEFVRKSLNGQKQPKVYGSYHGVYADPDVDIVYIGTPHAFHRQNSLDAINAGKHVLCEKPFTLNATEAKEVFAAARHKDVFVMEAMWTRFFPLTQKLISLIHEEQVIGDIHRVFSDFSKDQHLTELGSESRLKNIALGAGSLLNLGVYSLTWALLCLDPAIGEQAAEPQISAQQTLVEGLDIATSMILRYPTRSHAVVTSSSLINTKAVFCTVEGSDGTIEIEGATSQPNKFTVYLPKDDSSKKYEFDRPGHGLYWEADAVALDIAAGRTENSIMPWAETIRVLEMLDNIRGQGGARFPQNE